MENTTIHGEHTAEERREKGEVYKMALLTWEQKKEALDAAEESYCLASAVLAMAKEATREAWKAVLKAREEK